MTVAPLGDSAVVITLGDVVDAAIAARVAAAAAAIARKPPVGVVDIAPAFASIAVFFEAGRMGDFETVRAELERILDRATETTVSLTPRTLEVPVAYGGEHGPDLEAVAGHTGRSPEAIVALHTGAEYLVHAIGFAPGFPYLGGLAPELATPRRATPRTQVPAGSVGIGGAQTGIYPLETPGGWNLIGRTPLRLFDPTRAEPALLRAGDRVKFRALTAAEIAASSHVAGVTPGKVGAASDTARGAIRDTPAPSSAGDSSPGIQVVRAGMFTTVQDLGRLGHRSSGVPLSGAADPFALRLVNALVGNPEGAAGLEFTLLGPDLKFLHDTVVALGGADFGGVPRWRPFRVSAGAVLKLGAARTGCRGYLAVAGGVAVAPVLGSCSTYVRAGIGGVGGRALREGDVLPVPNVRRDIRDHWRIDERILPRYSNAPTVRVIAGAQAAEFDAAWTARSYRVSARSDRMGVRLTGEALTRDRKTDLISAPVAPGTVQIPPDGQPIVLLADAQTIGGYPQIAHVASVDLPLVAQLRPGDAIAFKVISLAEAQEASAARERALALLREGLAQKLA